MKSLLITGATGLLGECLLNQLFSIGSFQLYTLSRNAEMAEKKFAEKAKHFDISDFNENKICFDKIEIVVHCAFARAHKGGQEIAQAMLFTKNLFEELGKNGVKSLINISTQEVYGNVEAPWKEEQNVMPNTIYGTAKYYTELLTDEYAERYGFNATNIRLAGLLSVETDTRMVNKFVEKAINNKPLTIAKGKLIFSQMDVKDAVSGLIALVTLPSKKWNKVYNLGYSRSYSIKQIADVVQSVAREYNRNIQINTMESDVSIHAELDVSNFYRVTNWKPQYDMESIVREIFEYKLK